MNATKVADQALRPGSGQALEGIRVIELAGPEGEWCGKLFADMGADVIKVEPPQGSVSRTIGPFVDDEPDADRSLFFWHYNTSKRAITLDIATEQGRELLRALIDGADVFLETLPPGRARELGLDYETLSARNPRLVHVALTPFGQDGPYVEAGYVTTDLVTMALGGPMQSCGYSPEDGDPSASSGQAPSASSGQALPPVRPGQYHSYHTGSHYAYIGALAALWEREGSGQGQFIDVSAQAALAVTVEFASTHWEYDRAILRRQTGRHAGREQTARTQHLCADGKYVNLGLPYNQDAWQKLLALLREKGIEADVDVEALSDPQRRFAMGSQILDVLEVMTANMTSEELFHLGQSIGLTWGAVRRPEDWLEDPHAAARGFFVDVEHPELGRPVRYPGAPYRFTGSPWQLRRRAPLVGEDNAEVYENLRLSREDLTALREGGVI
jgi:crotonobetainyl-CoA:carnitine CoA-transferase CaiB-like acyl-CoA transferase